jgi:hypothetical protein
MSQAPIKSTARFPACKMRFTLKLKPETGYPVLTFVENVNDEQIARMQHVWITQGLSNQKLENGYVVSFPAHVILAVEVLPESEI